MADFAGGYSDLVEEAPVAFEGPIRHQERTGALSKADNVGGGTGGEVVRTVPKLVRSEP